MGYYYTRRSRNALHLEIRLRQIRYVSIVVVLVLRLSVVNSQTDQVKQEIVNKDIKALASLFPGCYSNVQQYHKHAQRGLPPNKRSLLIKSEFFLVTSPLLNDSLTIYFQDFTKMSSDPFRSGFYGFSFDYEMNVFRMRTYKLKRNLIRVQAKSDTYSVEQKIVPSSLAGRNITVSDLLTYKACDMFWKRIGENTFVGMTGSQCLGSLGSKQVHIGVSMTLTRDKLLMTEGWYNVKDGSNISEVKVPYILKKLKTADDQQNDSSSGEQDTEVKPKGRRAIQPKSLDRKKTPHPDRTADDWTSIRILRTFQQVAAALVGGHDVTYRVQLTACSLPQQIKLDRMSFGGRVNDFAFVRQDGATNDRTDYVYFVSKKIVTASLGSQVLTRELTFLRGGRVHVKVIKSYKEPNTMNKEYAFDCRLYDENKGFGGVKMFINQNIKPSKVPSYRSFVQALDQGRQMRVVTDLSRCQGTKRKPAVIFGNTVSEFDIVNGGKTLELYLPLVLADVTAGNSVDGEGFVSQFLKNGDVELTGVGTPRQPAAANRAQSLVSPAYHCKLLSPLHFLQSNDEKPSGVTVFSVG